MKYVYLNELEEGMVLAQPARDSQGVLLLKEGTSLSRRNIHMLKAWGVNRVCVVGDKTDEEDDNILAQSDDETFTKGQLKDKFIDVLEDQVMAEIMRVAAKLLERKNVKEEE
jgi:hypothetical protein